jgi:hypothetical protein
LKEIDKHDAQPKVNETHQSRSLGGDTLSPQSHFQGSQTKKKKEKKAPLFNSSVMGLWARCLGTWDGPLRQV